MGAWWVRQQLFQRLVQRGDHVGVGQRHRALGGLDDSGRPPGPPGQVGLEPGDVAQGRRHQHELDPGQLDDRHLPGPAPVGVGVEVELVHHDLADVRVGAVPQRDAGQHLGGTADDGRGRVDAGVAGHHAHAGRAERGAQGEELLRHQGLDRCRVERAAAVGQRREVRPGGHQALARAGRRGQDDVGPGHHLDQRLFLVRVEGETLLLGPAGERVEDRVGRRVSGEEVGEGHKYAMLTARLMFPPARLSPACWPRSHRKARASRTAFASPSLLK